MNEKIIIIGAGLAGSEAAHQIASAKIPVELYEMRPHVMTGAHSTDYFAELVCSNSLGSNAPLTGSGILKEELSCLGSFILKIARDCQVPAGASLAVDRSQFSQRVTSELTKNPLITIKRQEISELPRDGIVVVATGPLTSTSLATDLTKIMGRDSLYFYDAISPIVSADSLDPQKMFWASRYGKGGADFLNIPFSQQQYESFVDDILAGEVVSPHAFEENKYFESCLPVEVLAHRGRLTLAYGPMKPVGLTDPTTGRWPFAVIQLRAENQQRTAFNLVGFQTKLKHSEQERIFRKIQGLEKAEFLRLGSVHRNTFIHAPTQLLPTLQLRACPQVLVAGQLTGTEGYLESVASGLTAGINAVRLLSGQSLIYPPEKTMIGALLAKITDPACSNFQPMNANFGILPPLEGQISRDQKKVVFAERARHAMGEWVRACLG
ncbi:MAG: methylenetetrahydrofolate--tRNA-(uracil(54)-C(5))-methyltransferase (FADH(2)-oxidizing) TrmFO [Deltaproteobacteria bacterium]|nr:methylenetetrahydrofolate--tRNA-(uracil(54)-C(5))-methyltransferase (FADH(2)-oxidizing) TrmFO [Deltaproteobacteria bacterium]